MKTNGSVISNGKKSNYFLSLDNKPQQIYKVKIDNIQECDPSQIKTEEVSGNIIKFPSVR